ncbi:MAG: dihydroorotate dehydrogenase-like protein [Opitutales bacterium]
MNLETTYLGLKLKHPFMVGASPMARTIDNAKRAEDAGASAIVLHSLFEEQFTRYQYGLDQHVHGVEETFAEAPTYFVSTVAYHYGPEQYIEHVAKLTRALDIPVIASLNGSHTGGWTHYARFLEGAGAAALELNLYVTPTAVGQTGAAVEEELIKVVANVSGACSLPLAVKLSPYFTSLSHFAKQLELTGAKGLVLFNRFYQPDVDLEELDHVPTLRLSTPDELLLRLRWLAMLCGRVQCDLAITGGVHDREGAIKSLMSGADVIQLVSCLLKNGFGTIERLRREVVEWMEQMEYDSLEQLKGSMSHRRAPNPEAIERANYLKILQSWSM